MKRTVSIPAAPCDLISAGHAQTNLCVWRPKARFFSGELVRNAALFLKPEKII